MLFPQQPEKHEGLFMWEEHILCRKGTILSD